MNRQARADARAAFDQPTRIRLIEEDLDDHDATFEGFRKEQRRTNQLLTGVLVSITTACIVMVLTVLAQGGR